MRCVVSKWMMQCIHRVVQHRSWSIAWHSLLFNTCMTHITILVGLSGSISLVVILIIATNMPATAVPVMTPATDFCGNDAVIPNCHHHHRVMYGPATDHRTPVFNPHNEMIQYTIILRAPTPRPMCGRNGSVNINTWWWWYTSSSCYVTQYIAFLTQ